MNTNERAERTIYWLMFTLHTVDMVDMPASVFPPEWELTSIFHV